MRATSSPNSDPQLSTLASSGDSHYSEWDDIPYEDESSVESGHVGRALFLAGVAISDFEAGKSGNFYPM